MFKSISLTIIATFLGQVLGFFVDILIANHFGTTWKADSYFLALVIPVIFSDLFMLSINAVFIPSYMEHQKKGGEEDFFSTFTNASLMIFLGIGTLLFFFAPFLIGIMATNFTPEAKVLATSLTRVLLLLILTLPLSTILSCRLNAHNRFALPALGKSFNFFFIIIALLFLKGGLDIFSIPIGYIFGNFVFILTLSLLLQKEKLGYSLSLDLRHPALKEIAILLAPLIAATMVNYANIFIERSIAAGFEEGSISALTYAFKLVNIPLNLFILGGMTVIMQVFSEHAAGGDLKGLRDITYKGLYFVSFFMLPIITFLTVYRYPIIKILFERGQFSQHSTEVTALAVLFYSIGLLGLASVSIMSRVFYALKDLKTLSILGTFIIVLNIALMLVLSRIVGFIGIPLTFSITSTIQMFVMLLLLDKKFNSNSVFSFLKAVLGHGAVSLVMGIICIGIFEYLRGQMDYSNKISLMISLGIGASVGFTGYLALSSIFKIKEADYVVKKLLFLYSQKNRI